MDRPPVPYIIIIDQLTSSGMQVMLPVTYVATSEVSALKHEVGDDTVEGRSLVALTLGFQAQLTEVLGSLGDIGVEELEVDTTGLICTDHRPSV